MTREAALEDLYHGVMTCLRRARDMSDDLYPGLPLVAYTLLTEIDLTPGVRANDLCANFGLDKSTLSGQLEQLISAGYCAVRASGRRGEERRPHPGRPAVPGCCRAARPGLPGRAADGL